MKTNDVIRPCVYEWGNTLRHRNRACSANSVELKRIRRRWKNAVNCSWHALAAITLLVVLTALSCTLAETRDRNRSVGFPSLFLVMKLALPKMTQIHQASFITAITRWMAFCHRSGRGDLFLSVEAVALRYTIGSHQR